tara:strand:- start:8111 stop:8878 length:768 start_codon:yes stop_codon:yes gene_type:complete
MEIIPAIDLLNGCCVRLNQGDYGKVTEFNSDPINQAKSWEDQGATRLHLVDLDGAKSGKPLNQSTIEGIMNSINIPIQIGGGIRTFERAEEYLRQGINRVILGTIAIDKPNLVNDLADKYPQRVIVGIDAKNGKVATRGWIDQSEKLAIDLAKDFSNKNIAAIISTDIATDGTLCGPNITSLREIAEISKIPVIASGGIGSIADLLSLISLEQYGVLGVIVGRALYDGKIQLQEAMKSVSDFRIQDRLTTNSFIA